MAIPSAQLPVGTTITGKTSWFGGPSDPSDSGSTASGIPESTPGIAVYNRATLGKYWRVTFPNGKVVDLQQTDLGPAPWTGRVVDVLYSALASAGYTESNFPTDGNVTATFLGDSPGSKAPVRPGGVAGLGGTGLQANPSYPFQIGSTDNPEEDYWTAVNRIAQDVNWYLFSDGETLYFVDGADLIQQDPGANAFIDRVFNGDRIQHLNATFDNTAFNGQSTHTRKGKVQHKTRLTTAASPTEVQLDLICGVDEFRAGDIIVLSGCGPANGRWVIASVRRSVFATYSELRLVPPVMPLSEVEAAGTSGKASTTGTIDGAISGGSTREKVVAAAKKALQREQSAGGYSYAEVRPYPSSLYGPGTVVTDCSGFATLCYKTASAPDPNGSNYDGQGFTGTLEQNGKPTNNPQPGDLVFWSSPDHVGVYIGNGQCIEFGGNPGPSQLAVSTESSYHAAFLGYRTYL